MLFLSYSLTGASITVTALPRNRNTYTLLSVDNILQISLKTIFETSMGFKPRSSALALQSSANRAAKTNTLGAGQIVGYILIGTDFNSYSCISRHLHFK